MTRLLVTVAASVAALAAAPVAAGDPAALVNPLIGTEGNGHTFPGADVPFGMVQFSPVSVGGGPGGYEYTESRLRGFSLTRLSGAGCTNYGDVPMLPVTQPPRSTPPRDDVAYSHAFESAQPGSYQVRLGSGISVSLTATTRTGFGVFTYPSAHGTLLIDPSGSANPQRTAVRVDGLHRVVGSATSAAFGGACGHPPGTYTVYFALEFQQPFARSRVWRAGKNVGAYVTFDSSRVRVKAGISFVSIGDAIGNLAAEDAGWSFSAVAARARASWDSLLGRIHVTGGSRAERQIFYTALYHSLLQPNVFSDANGRYIGADGHVHTAVGYTRYANISGWDIYRGEMQLLALVAPRQAGDMIQSLVAWGQESGRLPRWPVANADTGLMVGDPSDAIIADAYAFGAQGFDTALALREILAGVADRPAAAAYLSRGYVPGAASTTLEYAIADFATSQLVSALGDEADAGTFLARSAAWKQLLNPLTGFIEPRLTNGGFPAAYSPTSTTGFVEGDGWQYTWLVPQDMGGLLAAIRPGVARQRLDRFFARLNAGPSAPYAWLGNEPSVLAPFAYLWLGVPWRTEQVVHTALTTLFTAKPDGLPGNDDLGGLSSWYVWSALGLYPAIPGVGGLATFAPLFPHATITLGNGQTLALSRTSGRYVRALTLNGSAWGSSWLPLSAIANGGTLAFTMGPSPSGWATSLTSTPPSFGG
jgi:predicted alpha-1,2-mannosidase